MPKKAATAKSVSKRKSPSAEKLVEEPVQVCLILSHFSFVFFLFHL